MKNQKGCISTGSKPSFVRHASPQIEIHFFAKEVYFPKVKITFCENGNAILQDSKYDYSLTQGLNK